MLHLVNAYTKLKEFVHKSGIELYVIFLAKTNRILLKWGSLQMPNGNPQLDSSASVLGIKKTALSHFFLLYLYRFLLKN